MRIALTIEYDGTRYYGSQRQRNVPTIQGELEEAIAKVSGEYVRTVFAGRTDQGVHAKGQVAVFETNSRLKLDNITKALNFYLPEDIAVKEAHKVRDDFDPRRGALSREYCYYIWNESTRSPLRRRDALLVRRPLEISIMDEACKILEGTHDFAPFASALEGRINTTRTVYRAGTYREGSMVSCVVEASAFLPHQMRMTVGSLLKVGLKVSDIAAFRKIFESGKPATAGPAVPPHGLFLMKVNYPGDEI
ncbi:MAG: tRNA pseudouridine(38-40) synthase TruA [Dehalococcoidia bacterium]